MKRRCHLPRWIWIAVLVMALGITKFSIHHVRRFRLNIANMLKSKEDFDEQNFTVRAERWIVVDATAISNDRLLDIADVPDWRIMFFGKNIRRFKTRRCSNCLFFKDVPKADLKQPPPVTNIKMASYVHAISHGAKWIYVTNQIGNLEEQIDGFHFEETVKGLLYSGKMTFDPDHHFGVKDLSLDLVARKEQASYLLGYYRTPSVQSLWKPPGFFIGSDNFDTDDIPCRLPHAIVPARVFPPTNLMGSLIEYRSFWVLGSLVTEHKSPSMAYWWVRLMRDIQESIGKYPPSCGNMSSIITNEGFLASHTQAALASTQCSPGDTLFTCGIHFAEAMVTQGFITQYDVQLLKSWFHALVTLNFKEPTRELKEKSFITGPTHRVVLEPTAVSDPAKETFDNPSDNPFQSICGPKLPVPNTTSVSPIRDILLVVVFNFASYYSNILYLDYIYRKYFTNIVYCGSKHNYFSMFQNTYLRPINYLEINEMNKGIHGYLCSAYAMEIGFKVSGYLQMADDVLLNMWNIGELPRDRIWFQKSIRKGSLMNPKVPNITPVVRQWYWWPWNTKKWGVLRLKKIWEHFELLKKTPERSRVVSFQKQLQTSFGDSSGAFYEASDIFYVPDKYKDDFSFFSKISLAHSLYLEIAIPTMLCGFDNITNILRLNGTYLWYKERTNYASVFNPESHFLHSWKLKQLMTDVQAKDFICTKYLPYVEGKSVVKK